MNGQVHRQYNSGLYILRHNGILQFNWLKYYCPDFDCICTDVARYQGHLIDLVNKQFRQLGDYFFFSEYKICHVRFSALRCTSASIFSVTLKHVGERLQPTVNEETVYTHGRQRLRISEQETSELSKRLK